MVLSQQYIRSLDGDRECLEALAYLALKAQKYPSGSYTPHLARMTKTRKQQPIIAATMRIGRASRLGVGARIREMELFDGVESISLSGSDEEICSLFAKRVLNSSHAGSLIVTTGPRRQPLDAFLASVGPGLLACGYTLQPYTGSPGISSVTIRKGRRTWQIVYAESAIGSSIDTGERLARIVGNPLSPSAPMSHRMFAALAAVADFLAAQFGSALRSTVGMTAMDAARSHLPVDFKKWRPPPLLVAMERLGRGYRGGLTYAERYRGQSWRIDVNRQYTAALRTPLPYASAFGRYLDEDRTPHGVYVCRLHVGNMAPYPIGVWHGIRDGFVADRVGRGSYVCVLHTSEFPGLLAHGCEINPSYGFTFTHTFDLAEYVDHIQAVIDTYGKDSPEGKLTKALGNHVYGKFGQRPDRTELLYSLENPGGEWFPFYDESGRAWETIWERKSVKHTATQHVDIAGAITGAARSQTLLTWQLFNTLGIRVVRCHTDSLTLDHDPSLFLSLDSERIGAWKLERERDDTVIVGANAFIDATGPHIAGISDPTIDDIERLYDGQVLVPSMPRVRPALKMKRGPEVDEDEWLSLASG